MISRRTFFRGTTLGLGGLYFAPFLRQLDAATAGGPSPARVLFFVQGNGIYPAEIQPQGIDRKKEPGTLEDRSLDGIKLPFSLEPLQPYAKKMTLLHGLSGRIARGSHNMGFAALGCWPSGKQAYGETVDAGMARQLGGIYPHVGVGVSNKPMALTYNVTSAGRHKALPTVLDPVLAHQQFFAAGTSGDSRNSFDVDTNLLDFLADDVKRMQSRLDGTDRQKLERYLQAFESMSGRQSKLAKMADQISKATPRVDPKLATISDSRTGPTGVFDRLEAQFDIAAGTLIAGLTNVATVSAAAGLDRIGLSCMASELGRTGQDVYIGAHAIGHGKYQNFAGLLGSECHAHIRRKCMEKLAKFIKTLESVPEGNGTMMDNTLVVYLSDSAEGHHPVCHEWPFVLIGDLGGRLKLGNRYLRYPWYGKPGHRTIASLYTSLLNAAGDPRKEFGIADSAIKDLDQTGPLAELIV
jgi:hypothetical protein